MQQKAQLVSPGPEKKLFVLLIKNDLGNDNPKNIHVKQDKDLAVHKCYIMSH